ncbi:MAG: cytochrome c [Burkholderiales bacterium]|nr:cytochrome c [Burkholderiales bacterium]MDE2275983.1 cytochrome c [Burkholderiales bacterium]
MNPEFSRRARRARRLMLLSTAVLAGAVAHAAGDVKAGRAKAQMCQACHGLDGVSKMPEAPNLAGQVEGYLIAQLTAFKSGQRRNEQMAVIVQALSPQQIEDVAAYYAAIEVKVGKAPGD